MEVKAISIDGIIIDNKQFSKLSQSALNLIKTANNATSPDSIDPMEKAIIHLFNQHNKVSTQGLLREYPLTRKLLAMTRVLQTGEEISIATKGAPEAILQLCNLNQE
jgi:magnesium-transporting ATPase (P-type)